MTWQSLLDPNIQEFIAAHAGEDVAKLALKKSPNAQWNYTLVLDQIKARQKAQIKVPSWFETLRPIVFPPPNLVEQASSQATALYKAGLFSGKTFVDLTGGMGVDSWAMAQRFTAGQCVELDPQAAALLDHNFKALGFLNVTVKNQDALEYAKNMPATDLVMIDPQRRDNVRSGKFKLHDCSPDLNILLPLLKTTAQSILIKTSPMLDIAATLEALENVSAVHVLEYRGECKEVLYILGRPTETIPITAVSLDFSGNAFKSFTFTPEEEAQAYAHYSMPQTYLYEPSSAFQKAGGFNALSNAFDVQKLHPHTHLYTSAHLKTDFPGRIFTIHGLYPVQAGKQPLERANLTLRNFPGTTDSLRKKLKIKDGGEDTLFACTLKNGNKALIHGRKA